MRRAMLLQFRVCEKAPELVKNCASTFLRNFLKGAAEHLFNRNYDVDYIASLDKLVTLDSDVQVSLLEKLSGKLENFAAYQMQYKDNRYKTYMFANIPNKHDQLSVQDCKSATVAFKNLATKYNAIFPSTEEQMHVLMEWYAECLGREFLPTDIANYILVKIVPLYLTDTEDLDHDELQFIYADMYASVKEYLRQVGYSVGKQFITNQYVPVVPDSKIQILHQNLYIHPSMNAICVLFGIQIYNKYYYGGSWMLVDLPNREHTKITIKDHKCLNTWIRERIDGYISYMKKEGVDEIYPVYVEQ